MILKASKRLERVLITGCCILDRNKVKLNCMRLLISIGKDFYTKDLSTDLEEFVLLEKVTKRLTYRTCLLKSSKFVIITREI